jgi:hypothetical protein
MNWLSTILAGVYGLYLGHLGYHIHNHQFWILLGLLFAHSMVFHVYG